VADSVLDLVDKLWSGEEVMGGRTHPVRVGSMSLEELADGVAFTPSFANVSSFATGDGLVLVDTGSQVMARSVHGQIRGWRADAPLHTAIYSHGHIDHVFGVPVFEEEARARGWPAPTVVAHEALPPRFDRYILTAGYNGVINQRQFQAPNLRWPTKYRYPDETYRDRVDLDVGGVRFELHHAKGETDDHTWTWLPEKKVLCTGDLFIWCTPNAGNPQKVQRYPREWAIALREMVALGPELLLPGHGMPIAGADRIQQALTDTADLLDALVDQSLALMNEGARLDDLLHTVTVPAHLTGKPYLQPIYDEPEFIVRNVWRLYGGWYDGNPAHLKPAPEAALASEIATLVGGARVLADRARQLADEGDYRVASHLAELAAQAAPEDAGVHAARAEVFRQRAETERSTMSKGVFAWAARESGEKSSESG
jgi:alkyl sulfatase BDS1-like metallo-beta-lactamase superfamily hydrolase